MCKCCCIISWIWSSVTCQKLYYYVQQEKYWVVEECWVSFSPVVLMIISHRRAYCKLAASRKVYTTLVYNYIAVSKKQARDSALTLRLLTFELVTLSAQDACFAWIAASSSWRVRSSSFWRLLEPPGAPSTGQQPRVWSEKLSNIYVIHEVFFSGF